MPEELVPTTAGQTVQVVTGANEPTPGTVGLPTQQGNTPTTVSAVAGASGGIALGNFVQPDIDKELFEFESDETPLMSLMLNAKKVAVDSPEVLHYMVDEQRTIIRTNKKVDASSSSQAILHLAARDVNLVAENTTLLVPNVNGYTEDGKTVTKGRPLMLFVVGRDNATQCPLVMAVNGPRTAATDEVCTIPDIPAGSELVILANALSETQKDVAPSAILPVGREVYLQKRGMTSIVSEYFDRQRKAIPFTQAIIAEHQIREFKRAGNRTLLAGRKGKFKVKAGNGMGTQLAYTTEGLRWQILREFYRSQSRWTFEEFVAMAKMFYTGEDIPTKAIFLCGKNLLESIQSIDFSKHPEVKLDIITNELGWEITRIKTVFGNIEIKRDPAFDNVGWSNSGVLVDYARLVHYSYKSETHYKEKVEGHEASKDSTIVWDALCLKGSCHMWVNGEGDDKTEGQTTYLIWDKATAPTGSELISGAVYYLLADCPAIHKSARKGQLWRHTGTAWEEFVGVIHAG